MFEIKEAELVAARAIALRLFDAGDRGGRPAVFYACALDDGEGTTSVVRALAEATARHGEAKLLVVDAAPRTRDISRQFGQSDVGTAPVASGLRNVTLLAAEHDDQGRALDGVARALAAHAAGHDAVVIDGVSLADEPDLSPIKGAIDGVLIVLESERHRTEVVSAAISELRAAGVPVAGTILNKKTKWIPEWIYSRL